jgi:hypothetical protein
LEEEEEDVDIAVGSKVGLRLLGSSLGSTVGSRVMGRAEATGLRDGLEVGEIGALEGTKDGDMVTVTGEPDGVRVMGAAEGSLEGVLVGAAEGTLVGAVVEFKRGTKRERRLSNVMLPRPVTGSNPGPAVKPDARQQLDPAWQHLLEPEVMSVNLAALA